MDNALDIIHHCDKCAMLGSDSVVVAVSVRMVSSALVRAMEIILHYDRVGVDSLHCRWIDGYGWTTTGYVVSLVGCVNGLFQCSMY